MEIGGVQETGFGEDLRVQETEFGGDRTSTGDWVW